MMAQQHSVVGGCTRRRLPPPLVRVPRSRLSPPIFGCSRRSRQLPPRVVVVVVVDVLVIVVMVMVVAVAGVAMLVVGWGRRRHGLYDKQLWCCAQQQPNAHVTVPRKNIVKTVVSPEQRLYESVGAAMLLVSCTRLYHDWGQFPAWKRSGWTSSSSG